MGSEEKNNWDHSGPEEKNNCTSTAKKMPAKIPYRDTGQDRETKNTKAIHLDWRREIRVLCRHAWLHAPPILAGCWLPSDSGCMAAHMDWLMSQHIGETLLLLPVLLLLLQWLLRPIYI